MARAMEKGCFKLLIVASMPARQRRARWNQRCAWCFARLRDRRPRAGKATFLTPSAWASRSFLAEKKPRSAVAISATRPKHAWCLFYGGYKTMGVGGIARQHFERVRPGSTAGRSGEWH